MMHVRFNRNVMLMCGLLIALGIILSPVLASAQATVKGSSLKHTDSLKKDYIDIKDFNDQLKG